MDVFMSWTGLKKITDIEAIEQTNRALFPIVAYDGGRTPKISCPNRVIAKMACISETRRAKISYHPTLNCD